MEQAEVVPLHGWSERLFAAVPLPPALLGGLLVAFRWLAAWASGDLARRAADLPWWLDRDARLAVVMSLLAAATLTALRQHAVGIRRDLVLVAGLGGWRLREIDAACRPGEPVALAGSPLEERDPPGLADLLAWRAQVAPEWPLDPSTLGRYGLFLAIPLASWVGGALEERALDRALG